MGCLIEKTGYAFEQAPFFGLPVNRVIEREKEQG